MGEAANSAPEFGDQYERLNLENYVATSLAADEEEGISIEHKKAWENAVQDRFRALVSQKLQAKNVETDVWLDIITYLAEEATNFVKPDTSRGGSLDPRDYVKIKCMASGSPHESIFVEGVVCTKNTNHELITSQCKNPWFLILAGALEYQPPHDHQLGTLLKQETDPLEMILSKMEAPGPNVLLVEKSISPYAQGYLFAKGVSLVSNVKWPLLERISRCTGAMITSSVDGISATQLGQCELFRLQEFTLHHEAASQSSKTFMFFDGCPGRFGCTVLLKGSSREELKKVKHVVQYAVNAAYRLSLEASFLADEGASATLPDMMMNRNALSSHSVVEEIMLYVSSKRIEVTDDSNEYFSASDDNQSNVCEPLKLLHMNFYGDYDKLLGMYLQDDLFDKCRSCQKPAEAHVKCYFHPQGKLTINVKRLSSVVLPGEKDGKIWMWHRCLRCFPENRDPPAPRRVVMSDAARGLSFGKFLELSFSNHSTACGHSLQRDCLRFYGLGSMVAIFRYSPVDILSVRLPPSVLEFSGHVPQDWLKKEVAEHLNKANELYGEILGDISGKLDEIKQNSISGGDGVSDTDTNKLIEQIEELKKKLKKQRDEYEGSLRQPCAETDVLYFNRLRDSLMSNLHDLKEKLVHFSIFERKEVKDNRWNSCLDFSYNEDKSWRTKTSILLDGACLFRGQNVVIAAYEKEPTSIVSCALDSKEYKDQFKHDLPETLDHLTVQFEDESGIGNYSVTCYFAKQFGELREKCFPSEIDYLRSLSRCKKFNAKGGKSGAYFAKSLDDRFFIKTVTKHELRLFVKSAPRYFDHLNNSSKKRTPTCLVKIFGVYEVNVKHLKGLTESKTVVMVMENLFFKKNISMVYDLKGSKRSRYNSSVAGTMLDMNLLEASVTNPLFLERKAKINLECAVRNDTSYLASIRVMDYSLLVGVDKESNELVVGIIDIMGEYTWQKWIETMVKRSGILGGHRSPTVISPIRYHIRFQKAMTEYFLTVQEQWLL